MSGAALLQKRDLLPRYLECRNSVHVNGAVPAAAAVCDPVLVEPDVPCRAREGDRTAVGEHEARIRNTFVHEPEPAHLPFKVCAQERFILRICFAENALHIVKSHDPVETRRADSAAQKMEPPPSAGFTKQIGSGIVNSTTSGAGIGTVTAPKSRCTASSSETIKRDSSPLGTKLS